MSMCLGRGLVQNRGWSVPDIGARTGKPPDVDVFIIGNAGNNVLPWHELEIDNLERVATEERHRLGCPVDNAHHATCHVELASWGNDTSIYREWVHVPRMA